MVNGRKIRIFIADDQRIMLDGMDYLLKRQSDSFEIVGQACDGQMAVRLASQLNPDVIVLDFNMPIMDGIEASREIIADNPDSRIMIMSSDMTRGLIENAVDSGVIGVMSKGSLFSEFFVALEAMMDGNAYFCPVTSDIIRQSGLQYLKSDLSSTNSCPV